MSRTITVMAVDDHPILRTGLMGLINAQPDMSVIAEANDGAEAIAEFRLHRPDVTLMDIRLGSTNGIDAIVTIRKEFPNARFVVLTTFSGDVLAARALRAGASGYLLKSMVRTELIDTIRAVHAGSKRIPAEIACELAEHALEDSLTNREVEILEKVAGGFSNKRIADASTLR